MLNRHFEDLKKKKKEEHTWEGLYLEEMIDFFERYKFYKLFVVVTSVLLK